MESTARILAALDLAASIIRGADRARTEIASIEISPHYASADLAALAGVAAATAPAQHTRLDPVVTVQLAHSSARRPADEAINFLRSLGLDGRNTVIDGMHTWTVQQGIPLGIL